MSQAHMENSRQIDQDLVLQWFPRTDYYRMHAERLATAFSRLPALSEGFSCLSVGSWGAEAPFLAHVLGASRVACVRAPEAGVPSVEVRTIDPPDSGASASAEIYALDIEREEFPEELQGFDLVLMWEVIEHLCVDPAWAVWQAAKAIKPGGIFSLTTPNALWHVYTTAQLFGKNSLGLKLQHHRPFATHWRLYAPYEIAELLEHMGCAPLDVTSILAMTPFSLKSRLMQHALQLMRRHSGNGACSYGQYVYVSARKERESALWRPEWLYPRSQDAGGKAHLERAEPLTIAGEPVSSRM